MFQPIQSEVFINRIMHERERKRAFEEVIKSQTIIVATHW